MKSLIAICIFAGISLSSCSQRNQKMDEQNNPGQSFASREEAASKGKSDLVELLRQKTAFQADINPADLEKATQGTPLETFQLNFDKLIGGDSLSSFAQIAGGKENTVVPLMSNGRVISAVEVAQGDKGWSVAGLHNNSYIRGLSAVQQSLQGADYSQIAQYEVPNIKAKIYVVTTPEGEQYYADYPGRYSPTERLQFNQLAKVIQADAREFQAKYGELLKKQKLVD
ncbi:MAG: hypothetical protein ACKVUS_17180 [Saprospiraceae bacterium]